MSVRAGQYAAAQLKRIAQRQVRAIGPRRRRMPIRPSEQRRRFEAGEEAWRVEAGLVTPEQYERYLAAMMKE